MNPEELVDAGAGVGRPAMGYLGEGYPGAGLLGSSRRTTTGGCRPPARWVPPHRRRTHPDDVVALVQPRRPRPGRERPARPGPAMSDAMRWAARVGGALARSTSASREKKKAASMPTPAVAGVPQGMATDGERAQRLERKEWSVAEDDTIRNGVALHGCGGADRGDAPGSLRRRRPQPWNRLKNEDAAAAAEGGRAPPPPKPAAPRSQGREGGGRRREARARELEPRRGRDDRALGRRAGHKWHLTQRLPGRTDHDPHRYHRLQAMSEDCRSSAELCRPAGLRRRDAALVGDLNLSAVLGPVPRSSPETTINLCNSVWPDMSSVCRLLA